MLEVPELASGNPGLQKAINKLVQAEERPLKKLDEKKAIEENKLKLVKDFKTKSSDARDASAPFRKPQDFRELKGTSSHPDICDFSSIDKDLAQLGSYDIEVIQMAMSNSISTYGFPDKDRSEVGIGYISFSTAEGEDKSVYINTENNTLDGVARAINGAKAGVRAYCVNDGSDADEPWRLIITGEKTGWKNNVEWPEFNMLDGDLDLDIDRTRDAQSAIIKFNGEPIMVDENKVKELLPGVTFDLKKAVAGQEIKLEIKPDYEKIEQKAKGMVEKLNAVLGFIQNQNQLTADSRKDPSKALGGDVVLHSVESQLRSVIQTTQNVLPETAIVQLRDLGIVFNKTGTLDYDGKKFLQQLEKNFDDVVAFFAGNEALMGFGEKLTKILEGVVRRGDGQATIKETSLQNRLTEIEKKKERATTKAEDKVNRAKMTFARIESSIQQMQTMSGNGNVSNLIAAPKG